MSVRIHPHDLLLQELGSVCRETQTKCLQHLADCPRCRERLSLVGPLPLGALLPKVLPFSREHTSADDYDTALKGVWTSLQPIEDSYRRERAGAASLYSELLRHPAERRPIVLRNCQRFHTWGFCELLLHRSQEQSFQDPVLGESLALLGIEVLDHLDPLSYGPASLEDLRARAWSYVGNARRIRSDLQGAEEAFEFAFSFLRLGTGDPLEKALLLDLKASLLTKQRRLSSALELLRRAVDIFLEVGDKHRAGRALVSMSLAHATAGEPKSAVSLLYRALTLIDSAREPRLELIAWHNLIDNLSDTGQFMEARKLLIKARPLYKRFAPWLQHFRAGIKGKIARGLGQMDQAEAHFLAARNGFLADDAAYEMALTSMDLASLYAEQGRIVELKRIAEEMVPIFSSRQIHREALAALDYWRQAVEAEQASASLVAGIAAFLKKARHNPELRFQRPE
jgi:tetratricopeptide (TPR) repeat protein